MSLARKVRRNGKKCKEDKKEKQRKIENESNKPPYLMFYFGNLLFARKYRNNKS